MMSRKWILAGAFAFIAGAACVGGATAATPANEGEELLAPQGPAITKIIVTPANAAVPRGGQWNFQAQCQDANNVNVPCPPGIVWTVENAVVGTVDAIGPAGGNFRAGQNATATIRATLGSVSGTATVSIT